MDPVVELERCIALVAASAARTARRSSASDMLPELPGPIIPTPGTPGHELAVALALVPDEVELLWSVVARAFDPIVAAHAREMFGPDARFGMSLAHHIAWRELPPERGRELLGVLDPRHPLRTSGILVAVGDAPHDVLTPWTTSHRVLRFLRGQPELDPSIAAIGGAVETPVRMRHSPEQRRVLQRLREWLAGAHGATILVQGAQGSGRRTAIALAAAPRNAIAVDFARVAVRRAEETLLALRREALLLDAVPVLANLDDLWARLAADEEIRQGLIVTLDAFEGPLVITATSAALELRPERRLVVTTRWPLPDAKTRRELWIEVLGDPPAEAELDLVAHRYELGAGGIAAAARSARHRSEGAPGLDALVAGIQDNIAERLGELAKRVEVTQQWDELVLPPETRDDVAMLIGRIRNAHAVLDGWGFRKKLARGAGVAALFSGPPGTGKTMVAGLIARELRLELYQVDLSRIVSKWIGETEKQLAKVFEAAEAGHALLLFDEADALFAKRSAEVKSAVDRYANLEVNYLLQRVESFGGVVILTTNLDTSIDPALRRRLASHIVFAPPEVDEREKLWRAMLDTAAPRGDDIDLRVLAEEFTDMTGANIRNATLAAAFLAAEESQAICQAHLQRAARGEYRAMGRMLARSS
jgi:hypothetical protein